MYLYILLFHAVNLVPEVVHLYFSTLKRHNLSFSTEGDYIKMFMRGRPITMFIPSDVENYDDVRTELPSERLKLEWVYPFCGHLHYSQNISSFGI